jgi:hypothetical protein
MRMKIEKCDLCGEKVVKEETWPLSCRGCLDRYGPTLVNAAVASDGTKFHAGLRNGWIVVFEVAEIHGNWVTLNSISQVFRSEAAIAYAEPHPEPFDDVREGLAMPFDDRRGLDVELRAIIWVATCDGELREPRAGGHAAK